jgi:hypothetical protein
MPGLLGSSLSSTRENLSDYKLPVGDTSQEQKSLGPWKSPHIHGFLHLMGWSVLLTLLIWNWIRISGLNYTFKRGAEVSALPLPRTSCYCLSDSCKTGLRVSHTSLLSYQGGKSFTSYFYLSTIIPLLLYYNSSTNLPYGPLYSKSSNVFYHIILPYNFSTIFYCVILLYNSSTL